jgi:hypothetical protein
MSLVGPQFQPLITVGALSVLFSIVIFAWIVFRTPMHSGDRHALRGDAEQAANGLRRA